MTQWAHWQRMDPNLFALRRGARAALVFPMAFLVARRIIGDAQALIFIIFGCFALLVMADFGGPRRARSLAYLGAVLGFEVGGDVDALRGRAVRAGDRAGEGLQVLVSERGAKHLEPLTAAALVTAGNQGMLAVDALTVVATDLGYRAEKCADAAAAIRSQVQALLAQLTSLADRLENDRDAAGKADPASARALRAAVLGCLDRTDGEPAAGRSAFALIIAGEWAQNLARLEADLEQPVSAAVAAARIPWWR